MNSPTQAEPFDLAAAAAREMATDGFDLTPVPGAADQLAHIVAAAASNTATPIDADQQDLRSLAWSSIDNDTSRDLDQIEWAERVGDDIRVRIGIADVASTIAKDTPIDTFAQRQAMTVYTAARNFPMLPTELSTGLTSLNPGEERNALIAEFLVTPDGTRTGGRLLSARVTNHAQLAYSKVGAWLSNKQQPISGSSTQDLQLQSPEFAEQIRLQAEAATRIRMARTRAGALDFRRNEATPVVADGQVLSLSDDGHNAAMDLIEDLMIAANETVANTLASAGRSSLRRVVRSPERWARIVQTVQLASKNLAAPITLPAQPDAKALNDFLTAERERDPEAYPDLALAIIKLMGAGEYVLASAKDPDPPGHFALAAHDYAHSTAPNRRFADLVEQRIVHAMLRNEPPPYTDDELTTIAAHCNDRDKAARKVERAMLKRAQAAGLSHAIGTHYRAIVTGAGPKGTFVRVLSPPVEGMLVKGGAGLDVGDKVSVTLVHTDVAKAFIDFARDGA